MKAKKSPAFRNREIRKGAGTFKITVYMGACSAVVSQMPIQDKHILAHKPTYLAIASQMHCEISPRFVADHQESRPKIAVLNGTTPRTVRQPILEPCGWAPLVHHTVGYHDGKGGNYD